MREQSTHLLGDISNATVTAGNVDNHPRGYHYAGTYSTNLPPNAGSGFVFTVSETNYSDFNMQICWDYEHSKFWIRAKHGSDGWVAWKEI